MADVNPFQQLLDQASKPALVPSVVEQFTAEAGGPTQALLYLLDINGPMTTAQLARSIDRSTNIVHGLLKSRRKAGVVNLDGGLWSLNRDVQEAEHNAVMVAVELLRSLGWTVLAPRAAA